MINRYIIYINLTLLVMSVSQFHSCKTETTQRESSMVSAKDSLTSDYIGRQACIPCHQKQYNLWGNSDHDLAMQVANDTTVLGNFNNATFTWYGVTSRFYVKDGIYYVNTEGEDGDHHDYKVSYTFGVRPLQQYLVRFPDGRLQTLPLCWDARPKKQGGAALVSHLSG